MSIRDKRINYKPFEYPEVKKYIDAINSSFWVHNELNFTADVQDFKTELTDNERLIVKRSLLLIAQIEVAVKKFWGDLYNHFPKPEFNGLGSTFAECEFRHSEAYSELLSVLGYENEFNELVETDMMKERMELFSKYLSHESIEDKLFYFVIVVENAALFTQFASILALCNFKKGAMKNIANVIAWTSIDEQIHSFAGIWLLNELKRENPELTTLNRTFKDELTEIVENEDKLVDYIYEFGEFPWFTKQDMKNFMRYRIDIALKQLDMPQVFNITFDEYKPLAWFEQEVFADKFDDFFAKRPTQYTKHNKSNTEDDLF